MMNVTLSGVPTALWVAIFSAMAGGIGWLANSYWTLMRDRDGRASKLSEQGWAQAEHKDHEIVSLRRAMDRSLRRENAYATGCELLLIAMPHSPTPEQVMLVTRARQIFETALLQSSPRDGG